jgi:transcriptional regulator with XRE-family HTH domain
MGARLRAIRKSLGYKQSDVAAMMGRGSRGAVTIISRLYWAQVPVIWMAVEETDGKPAERGQRLERFLAQQGDRAGIQRVVELVLRRYDELKKLMLPDPADWPGAVDPGPKRF